MNRKKFIKNSLMGLAATTAAAHSLNAETSKVETPELAQVGFNHIPNKEERTMKTVLHRADTRGHADHGWLNTHHSFSFANYRNPERMSFGVLRVLNDDSVAAQRGFGKHPHDNMEIISIPLEGALEHEDSMGNQHVIKKGDVQVMSAGTGIYHSEKNRSKDVDVKFLQIWVFPKERNIEPRYDQIAYNSDDRINKWQRVVSPESDGSVMINQDAYFSMTNLEKGKSLDYQIARNGNGVYAFILEGTVSIDGQDLNKRDGFGVWDTDKICVTASEDAEILLMDIPMEIS
ncbi:MAG: redox-sensitive bicupin YhaK (pirin superfamily) [Saprospiraceae bacterium]|jgi:redox-sensitive bicupin YhaK (pirin superfamily)